MVSEYSVFCSVAPYLVPPHLNRSMLDVDPDSDSDRAANEPSAKFSHSQRGLSEIFTIIEEKAPTYAYAIMINGR